MKYDEEGNVVLATAGADISVGIAIIEAGYNDISGNESGKVTKGNDIDIQIKDIGYVVAGTDIEKGAEITAGAEGKATAAASGNYVLGIALSKVTEGNLVRIQISKYQKA